MLHRAVVLTAVYLCIDQCSSCFAGSFDDCSSHTEVGTSCCLDANLASPTQFVIGYTEARCKQGRFEAMSNSELQKYLAKHTVPVVTGPDGYYITDHHHLIFALLAANLTSTHHVVARINYNWSDLSRRDFLKKMVSTNLVWLYDEKGHEPMNPLLLPSSVSVLPNDPYRSLASRAEYAGCFLNDGTPFCQFQWANFFRNADLFNTTTQAGAADFSWCQANPFDSDCFGEGEALASALPKAMQMCNSNAAKEMCGFGKGIVAPADCGNNSAVVSIPATHL